MKEVLKELAVYCRFFVFVFCALLSILIAFALAGGAYLYEPNVFIARVETVFFMAVATISVTLAYLEIQKTAGK